MSSTGLGNYYVKQLQVDLCFSVLDDFGKCRIEASSPRAMRAKSNLAEHVSLDYCCAAFWLYQSSWCADNSHHLGSEWVIESVQATVNWSLAFQKA